MRAIILAALICLAGCVPPTTIEKGQRDIFDQSRISQIQQGSTTKDNIIVLFGQPGGKGFEANGDETWTYTYASRRKNPLLPGPAEVHSAALIVTFDKRGIVKSYDNFSS
jgi:outer membrane protein assembly factor BamE (lipoprotein component of BamABCDE complex)